MKITILGAGNFGTALGFVWAKAGHRVNFWAMEKSVVKDIQQNKTNNRFLKKVRLPVSVKATISIAEALVGADVVVLCCSSHAIPELLKSSKGVLPSNVQLINAAKGFDTKSLKTLPQAIKDQLALRRSSGIFQISGPSFAKDLVKGSPTAVVLAGPKKIAEKLSKKLSTKTLQVLPSSDLNGVSFAGSAKNAYVIALGMCDGAGYGMNTKGIIVAKALAEMTELVKKVGGKKETIYGPAGIGDFVATGFGASRNRLFGETLVKTGSQEKAVARVGSTIEGIDAVSVMSKLAKKKGLKLPLLNMIETSLKKSPKKTFESYFNRAY